MRCPKGAKRELECTRRYVDHWGAECTAHFLVRPVVEEDAFWGGQARIERAAGKDKEEAGETIQPKEHPLATRR